MPDNSNDSSTNQETEQFQTLSVSESEFWRWFQPSLAEDWMRGVVGEYWVANALDLLNEPREAWKPWDLETKTGIKVEVKTSGCLRRKAGDIVPVKNIQFDIEAVNVDEDLEQRLSAMYGRPANVYVFCLHSSLDPKTLDPLCVSQWKFYVIATRILNDKRPNGKSISLNPMKKLGAEETDFAGLNDAIIRAANVNH